MSEESLLDQELGGEPPDQRWAGSRKGLGFWRCAYAWEAGGLLRRTVTSSGLLS